jgi:hypothetical protein
MLKKGYKVSKPHELQSDAGAQKYGWVRDTLSGNQKTFTGGSQAMGWGPLSKFVADLISTSFIHQAGPPES